MLDKLNTKLLLNKEQIINVLKNSLREIEMSTVAGFYGDDRDREEIIEYQESEFGYSENMEITKLGNVFLQLEYWAEQEKEKERERNQELLREIEYRLEEDDWEETI